VVIIGLVARFKDMEKSAEKSREQEKKAAQKRAAAAVIWGTEILKGDFDAKRGTKKVQEMMWGAQGFQGIPFEVRGQVWAKAIGTTSG
jgi:hypothetical protein